MSARRSTSSTAHASSMAARSSSPAARKTSSATRMSAASIWAKVSSCKMALGPRLDLRQSQSLVMTPQLQQAIRLLALSNLEIESFIAEELERNPLLDTGGGEGSDGEPPAAREGEAVEQDGPAEADALVMGGDATADAPLDMDYNDENLHQDSAADRGLDGALGMEGLGSSGGFDGEGPDFDRFAAEGLSLAEHLVAQAGERLSGEDLIIA